MTQKTLPEIVEAEASTPTTTPSRFEFSLPCVALVRRLIAVWRVKDAVQVDAKPVDPTLCLLGLAVILAAGCGYFGFI